MVGVFLGLDQVRSWDEISGIDQDLFARFFRAALERGVLLPPSAFETWFLMEAHLDSALEVALDALEEAIEVAA
jgi:glutamate-1-semialdehyde 2,1-aminomutase